MFLLYAWGSMAAGVHLKKNSHRYMRLRLEIYIEFWLCNLC